MHCSSNRFSSVMTFWFKLACFALLFCQQARPQDAFDSASKLMKQWSVAQQKQQQQPSDTNLEKLRQATTSISREVPGLLKTGTLELLNSRATASPTEVREKIASVLADVPSTQYEPKVSVFQMGAGKKQRHLLRELQSLLDRAHPEEKWPIRSGFRGNRIV
jgi:hypothetical protein